jgi:hypothetical protein
MKNVNRITGPGCFQQALRKARFGHRRWIVYRDANGPCAERQTAESLKRCLLTVGTQGNWTLICEDGVPMKGFWRLGINLLSQSRHGF